MLKSPFDGVLPPASQPQAGPSVRCCDKYVILRQVSQQTSVCLLPMSLTRYKVCRSFGLSWGFPFGLPSGFTSGLASGFSSGLASGFTSGLVAPGGSAQ